MKQETFKVATVLTLTCKYGHAVDIVLECINKTKRHSSDNFKINFYFILATQLLGKGLWTMCTFLGLLGICTSEGDYKVWKKIQDKIGESKQWVAKWCCDKNLWKKWRLPLPQAFSPSGDGWVPIACSSNSNTGWQGNGAHMTYNSQVVKPCYAEAALRRLLHLNAFWSSARLVKIICQGTQEWKNLLHNTDVQKTGLNPWKAWNRMVSLNVLKVFGHRGLLGLISS